MKKHREPRHDSKQQLSDWQQTVSDAVRNDSWSNTNTGYGNARDKRMYSQVDPPTRINVVESQWLFDGEEIAKRICILPAKTAVSKWLTVSDGELNDKIQAFVREKKIIQKIIQTIALARAYGGALLVLGVDDGRAMQEPLGVAKSIKWLRPVPSADLQIVKNNDDITSSDYDEPEIYRHNKSGMDIHASRTLRFDATLTTDEGMSLNNGWSYSLFSAIYEELRAYWSVYSSLEIVIQDFSVGIYTLKDLADVVSAQGEAAVRSRLESIEMQRSVNRGIALADGEDFKYITQNIQGLADLADRFQGQLSSVTGIPVSLLFGRSPAGLNATGKGDLEHFYGEIETDRTLYIDPQVQRLIDLIGSVVDDTTESVAYVWNPIAPEDQTAVIANRKTQAETDKIYVEIGVASADEIAKSRLGKEYSFETELDAELRADFDTIESADDD